LPYFFQDNRIVHAVPEQGETMKAARILKEKINSETITVGLLMTFDLWPGAIDMALKSEMDYIIIDREHGMHSDELVASVCAAGRLADFPVLVRPVDTAYSSIRRAADMGACGFLLPTVESPDQLDMVRDSIYMPPRGKRRPGGPGNYWVSDVNYPTWKKEVEDAFIVLPQIETKLGLNRVDAIAGHEITTAIAVGPYDLSADLGVCYEADHPKLLEALGKIREAGKRAKKNMWHLGDGPTLRKQGYTFICLGDPISLMEASLASIASKLKR
jgi:2-keto-3-deoxy-L-rhamnonate aldolase RhmA